jgi:hypothetical protein
VFEFGVLRAVSMGSHPMLGLVLLQIPDFKLGKMIALNQILIKKMKILGKRKNWTSKTRS